MSDRRVQHRAPRDTSTQEMAELKRENKNLKRQLARANREIERLQGLGEKTEAEEKPLETGTPICPKCGSSDLAELPTPSGKSVTTCRSCKKWRTKPS